MLEFQHFIILDCSLRQGGYGLVFFSLFPCVFVFYACQHDESISHDHYATERACQMMLKNSKIILVVYLAIKWRVSLLYTTIKQSETKNDASTF